jgi:hypothetical protein
MQTKIFLVAISALATAWLPAPAHADCDAYNKKFLKFKELQKRVLHEVARVEALKPLPETDTGLCRAALDLMMQANLIGLAPEPTCFENKAQMDGFADQVHAVSKESWTIAQTFCSDEDMRRR